MTLTHLLRVAGWAFIAAGLVILLYLAYSLLFTNIETEAAQAELLDEWELEVGEVDLPALRAEPAGLPEPVAVPAVAAGDALAVLEFERPGSDSPLVHDGPLFVVEGVGLDDLQRGPGHYPDTSLPGEQGNIAIAGHRTTYGAPFFHLERVEVGDVVWLTDRAGTRWRYEVVEERIVAPTANDVLGPDPRGSGVPTLTLTTCHPRFSNRQRLVVFAELAA